MEKKYHFLALLFVIKNKTKFNEITRLIFLLKKNNKIFISIIHLLVFYYYYQYYDDDLDKIKKAILINIFSFLHYFVQLLNVA